MNTQTLKRCGECGVHIHPKNGCLCPKFPFTIRFHFTSKTRRRFDYKDFSFICQKVVDANEYRLFRTKSGMMLDCVNDVSLSLMFGEPGFEKLLEKFLAIKEF